MNKPIETAGQPAETLRLADCATLQRMRLALAAHLTRVWPTRLKALTPPAMAGLTTLEALALEDCFPLCGPQTRVLTLFVPPDFKEALPAMVQQPPRLRVQPDTSLTAQCAYVSWETRIGHPPLAVWVEVDVVLQALEHNEQGLGLPVLPMLLVAGDLVVGSELMTYSDWTERAQAAIEHAARPPANVTEDALKKAAQTAQRYSERPWLFMRYELKNGDDRLAVNWAPVQKMHAGNAEG